MSPTSKSKRHDSRRLRLFSVLAPLSALALVWVTWLAIEKERAINESRLYWAQKTQVERIVNKLDSSLRVLFTRESTLAVSAFQSYINDVASDTPGARFASPLLAPAVLPSGLGPSFQRLYFEVDSSELIHLPGVPIGADRELALSRGHTTRERIQSAQRRGAMLQRFAQPKLLLSLLRLTAVEDAKAAQGASPIAPFHAFLLPVVRSEQGEERRYAELLLLRRVDSGTSEKSVQGIWYDWPALRQALRGLADADLGSAELDLSPSQKSIQGPGAPPPGKSLVRRDGGRLATLALNVNLGGRPTTLPFRWSATTTSLAGAWFVFIASLAALHTSLKRSVQLAEKRARFASAVTHELRTPLTTFCMYTEMLKEGMVTDEAQRQEYLETLHRESGRLRHIVDNVLQNAGIEQGSSGVATPGSPVPLSELLNEVLPALERRCQASGFELQTELGEIQGESASAAPQSIERILVNLIDNACKYGVPVGNAKRTVQLRAHVGRGFVKLLISDNGPGVSELFVPKLFDAYERGSAEATGDRASAEEGLGLGLSLSRELARGMGGDLSLQGTPSEAVTRGSDLASEGTGATFCLRLPLAKPAAGM